MLTPKQKNDLPAPQDKPAPKSLKKRTGLFFGSFNPIHNGHLMIANYILEYSELDEIFFVVSPQNPFKKKKNLLNARDRLELVRLALQNEIPYQACDIELKMPVPSYTIDTLTYLEDKYPQRTFSLIMGGDNLRTLHKWKNSSVIQKNYDILVYPRPRQPIDNIQTHPRIITVDAPLIEISSTLIRNSIKEGKNLSFFMPETCWRYIREMHFYEK
ncbi:MAG: nicotinic acid mononucleotide adenylyltransferase [Bacteroidia bacterium]|nr:MAG: nicotinic acid mononucleotide adenylyltransferase [Bacteroidia bacterium]